MSTRRAQELTLLVARAGPTTAANVDQCGAHQRKSAGPALRRGNRRIALCQSEFALGFIQQLDITWELSAQRLSEDSCELSNRVAVRSPGAFLELLGQAGVTALERRRRK